MVRKANFKLVSECNWKNTFFNLPNVDVWLCDSTNTGRALATTYTGDHHFRNLQYIDLATAKSEAPIEKFIT